MLRMLFKLYKSTCIMPISKSRILFASLVSGTSTSAGPDTTRVIDHHFFARTRERKVLNLFFLFFLPFSFVRASRGEAKKEMQERESGSTLCPQFYDSFSMIVQFVFYAFQLNRSRLTSALRAADFQFRLPRQGGRETEVGGEYL